MTKITDIKTNNSIKELAAQLKSNNSAEAGIALLKEAKDCGLGLIDYVNFACSRAEDKIEGLNGFESLLAELNLPTASNYKEGVTLQAASETFQKFPGVRALFPEYIDQTIRWSTRQDSYERVEPMISGSITTNSSAVLSTVIGGDNDDYKTFKIAEGGAIPVRTMRASQKAVQFHKVGSGIQTTYEFTREVSLDILTPYLARVQREMELSKSVIATSILINGDASYGAAPIVTQKSIATANSISGTAEGIISWRCLFKWLLDRAKAGTPIDTLIMNWDSYYQYVLMFGTQGSVAGDTEAQSLTNVGANLSQVPAGLGLPFSIIPVLSSSVPAGKLVGINKNETIQEMVLSGSSIQESEQSIRNQLITIVRTQTVAYRLLFGDTRSIYDFVDYS